MTCGQTEKVSLLIDGELSPAEVRALESHLVECETCQSARSDFLLLRSQITNYGPLLDQAATRQALAQVMSRREPATRNSRKFATGSRLGWLGPFSSLRFNPALATVVILLVAGGIAFVLYRAQQDRNDVTSVSRQEQGSKDTLAGVTPTPTAASDESVSKSGSPDLLADNSRRKPLKNDRRESYPNQRRPASKIKPTPERSSPKPTPQPFSSAPPNYARTNGRVVPADDTAVLSADSESLTARHLEQSELLLRSFRNIRLDRKRGGTELSYERKRAQELVNRNILLRREADASGDIQVATLLGSLEPILLDIANLRDKPRNDEVRTIKDRVERQSLVALLQVNAVAVARANE